MWTSFPVTLFFFDVNQDNIGTVLWIQSLIFSCVFRVWGWVKICRVLSLAFWKYHNGDPCHISPTQGAYLGFGGVMVIYFFNENKR